MDQEMNKRERRRKIKQLIIVGLPSAFLIFLVVIIFFLSRPAPSCFDNKKNQNEEGIDCGGPCLPCYIKYAKPLEVISQEVLPVTQNFSEVLVKLRNDNEKVAGKFHYQVRFFDSFSQILKEEEGESFILPLSSKYIVLPKVDLKAKEIFRVEFLVKEVDWQEFPRPAVEIFEVLNKKLRWLSPQEPGFLELNGEIVNKTSLVFSQVEVVILLYSKTGEIINATRTILDNFGPQERRSFQYVWHIDFIGSANLDPNRVEVLVDGF